MINTGGRVGVYACSTQQRDNVALMVSLPLSHNAMPSKDKFHCSVGDKLLFSQRKKLNNEED
jgi:hypothetical protein